MLLATLMGLKTISCHDVMDLLAPRAAVVFDVNSPARWAGGHVPGARTLDPSRFDQGDLPPDRDTMLVFYCSNPMCRKAPLAARRARAMGHANVRVMADGIEGWMSRRLPIEAGHA